MTNRTTESHPRATLLNTLIAKDKSPWVAIDAGNLVGTLAPSADVLNEGRAVLSMMGYSVVATGPGELALGYRTLSRLESVSARVVLTNVGGNSGENLGMRTAVVQAGTCTIEVMSIIDPKLVPPEFTSSRPIEALKGRVANAQHTGRLPLVVGYLSLTDALQLANSLPGSGVLLLSSADAPRQPRRQHDWWLVGIPTTGHQIDCIRLEHANNRLVRLSATEMEVAAGIAPDSKVAEHIRKFIERSKIHLTPVESHSALSDASIQRAQQLLSASSRECGSCHGSEKHQWAQSKHARAWETLVIKGAQERAECISCHTTPVLDASFGSTLSGVSCTTCHAGADDHASRPLIKGLVARTPKRNLCVTCHTAEQSPEFDYIKFLAQVKHR